MVGLLDELGIFADEMGYERISSVILRPVGQLPFYRTRLKDFESVSHIAEIALKSDHDWPNLARTLQTVFGFPSSVEHSFQAAYDWLTDLSWLSPGHYVLLIDLSEIDSGAETIYFGLDALLHAIAENGSNSSVKISVVVFV